MNKFVLEIIMVSDAGWRTRDKQQQTSLLRFLSRVDKGKMEKSTSNELNKRVRFVKFTMHIGDK
jgi:hypothetical protein